MSGVRGAAKESQEGKLQGAAAESAKGNVQGVAAAQQQEKQQSGQGQVRASCRATRSRAAAAVCAAPGVACRDGARGWLPGRRRRARHAALRARERRGDQLARRERCARLAFGSAFGIIAC
jgi:hypothetical protein